jgi:hypothetical protein
MGTISVRAVVPDVAERVTTENTPAISPSIILVAVIFHVPGVSSEILRSVAHSDRIGTTTAVTPTRSSMSRKRSSSRLLSAAVIEYGSGRFLENHA